MASSKLLKERIESIQDTRKITNAMYLISSSKLRKARKNYQNVLPYFTRMRDTISRVVPHLPDEPVHPFFHKDSETRPISDGFRKNNVNYWAFREIRSIIPHL
jgi:F-type H+-transporting ATPase subunit gamma